MASSTMRFGMADQYRDKTKDELAEIELRWMISIQNLPPKIVEEAICRRQRQFGEVFVKLT